MDINKLPTTKEEVLQILINRQTPRAYDERHGACTYDHDFNGGCAVGQCVTKKQALKMEGSGNKSVTSTFDEGTIPDHLRLMGSDFLERIQNVHDVRDCWHDSHSAYKGEDGLVWNEVGKSRINSIIRDFDLNLKELKL